jgi:hypothetical protein
VVRDKKGRRITEAQAQRPAEEALARTSVGRPSPHLPLGDIPRVGGTDPARHRQSVLAYIGGFAHESCQPDVTPFDG